MASLGFLHQLVNEKMEADQVRERRVTKELNVQVLLQPLKIRPRPFKRILLVGAAEVGIQVSAAQHTLALFSLTLNRFAPLLMNNFSCCVGASQ